MLQAARANGIAPRTLDRAKKSLGVKVHRIGFDKDGRWFWSWPGAYRADGGHEEDGHEEFEV